MDEQFSRRVSTAQARLVGASIELWNVRAEHLKTAGDLKGLLQLLADPVSAAADNCECNQGCNVPCGSNCGALTFELPETDDGP